MAVEATRQKILLEIKRLRPDFPDTTIRQWVDDFLKAVKNADLELVVGRKTKTKIVLPKNIINRRR